MGKTLMVKGLTEEGGVAVTEARRVGISNSPSRDVEKRYELPG
jgi:hypothetical protein